MSLTAEFSDPVAEAERSITHRVYNKTVRPLAFKLFGRQIASFGGVMVRYQAATDVTYEIDYKPKLQRLIETTVTPEDHVVDIAAGQGVFAVWAARNGATVDTYEGAENMVRWASETATLNGISDRIEVHHRIVASGQDFYGDTNGAQTIAPEDLPEMDVLILDCEGAETEILRSLTHRPRAIIVETHPDFGAPAETVRTQIEDLGYRVQSDDQMDRPGKSALLAVKKG